MRLKGLVCNFLKLYKQKNANLSSQHWLCSYVLQFESGLFSVFMWRHGRHVGVQNNSEKSLLGLWFCYHAKLERHFAIVLYTNMAISSCEWKPRIGCAYASMWPGSSYWWLLFLWWASWISLISLKVGCTSLTSHFLFFNFGTSCNSYKMEGDRIWKAKALFFSLLYSKFHFLKNIYRTSMELPLIVFLRAHFTHMIKFHWGM